MASSSEHKAVVPPPTEYDPHRAEQSITNTLDQSLTGSRLDWQHSGTGWILVFTPEGFESAKMGEMAYQYHQFNFKIHLAVNPQEDLDILGDIVRGVADICKIPTSLDDPTQFKIMNPTCWTAEDWSESPDKEYKGIVIYPHDTDYPKKPSNLGETIRLAKLLTGLLQPYPQIKDRTIPDGLRFPQSGVFLSYGPYDKNGSRYIRRLLAGTDIHAVDFWTRLDKLTEMDPEKYLPIITQLHAHGFIRPPALT